MNEAHVFQHKYTGVQIFVYHCNDEFQAKSKLVGLIINTDNWLYLCKKVATEVKE